MRARLTCAAVCLLLVGADSGPTFLSETRLEFLPGSRWELVQGWKGDRPVTDAWVEFRPGNQVKVTWKVLMPKLGEGTFGAIPGYETDPEAGSLTLLGFGTNRRKYGTIRVVGTRLLLRLDDLTRGELWSVPGDLYLVLKPAK